MGATLAVMALIAGVFYRPLVIRDGWTWLLVPLGVQPIDYWQSWGFSILVCFLTSRVAVVQDDKENWKAHAWAVGLGAAFAHGMLWLVCT